MAMPPIDAVKAVLHWQAGPFHPLTCGINSRHPKLTAIVHPDGYAVMVCIHEECGYAQRYIPDSIFKYWKHTKPKRDRGRNLNLKSLRRSASERGEQSDPQQDQSIPPISHPRQHDR